MNQRNIIELASSFRQAIERAQSAGEFNKDISFGVFPRRCCGDTSCLLGHFLLKNGIQTRYVCGNYYGDDCEYGQSHAWLELPNGTIIDITADQFKNKPIFLNNSRDVYVGKRNSFYQLFEVDERRDIHDTVYLSELGEFCYPRLISIYNTILRYM